MKQWIFTIIIINLLMFNAGGTAYWSSKINWYNGSWLIMPKWTAPLIMPTSKAGKAMHLTTMIPTTSETFIPDSFNPEKNYCHQTLVHFQHYWTKMKSCWWLPLRRYAPSSKVSAGMLASLQIRKMIVTSYF